MEYKVKNLRKDERKFRDRWLGKEILVGPGETVITRSPPEGNDIWKVEDYVEKTEETKIKKEVISKKMEIRKNGKLNRTR